MFWYMEENPELIVQEPSLIREANELVEARYRFDTWEDRLFLMALSQIHPDDEDFKEYKIYIRDLMHDCELHSNRVYEYVRAAVESMRQKRITIPYRFGNDEGLFTTGLLTAYGEVNKRDELSYVVIELHPKLKPFLLQLKERYTQYNMRFLMKMQSGHSRRIYKLLKQYEKLGKRRFEVKTLRELLCIGQEEYPHYYDFKRRVILKAQEDLSLHTDLVFDFEEERKSRSINAITFFIRKNPYAQQPSLSSKRNIALKASERPQEESKAFLEELYSKVEKYVSRAVFEALKQSYSQEQIARGVVYTLDRLKEGPNKHKISNIGGYIVSMIKQFAMMEQTEQKPSPKKLAAPPSAPALPASDTTAKPPTPPPAPKLTLKRIEQQIAELKAVLFQEEQKIVHFLLQQEENLREVALEKLRHQPAARVEVSLGFETNYKTNPFFRLSVKNLVEEWYPQYFENIRKTIHEKIFLLEQEKKRP